MSKKEKNDYHFGDSELGEGIGLALIILALCLGMGGCYKLVKQVDNEEVKIKNSFNNENNK